MTQNSPGRARQGDRSFHPSIHPSIPFLSSEPPGGQHHQHDATGHRKRPHRASNAISPPTGDACLSYTTSPPWLPGRPTARSRPAGRMGGDGSTRSGCHLGGLGRRWGTEPGPPQPSSHPPVTSAGRVGGCGCIRVDRSIRSVIFLPSSPPSRYGRALQPFRVAWRGVARVESMASARWGGL